jgi:DNA-binding protein HU-beta
MATKPPVKKTAPTKSAAPLKAVPTKAPAKAAPAATAGEKYSMVNLRDDIAEALPIVGRATIEKVMLATFSAITKAYAAGKVVNIKDFGKLEIKHRPERQGRNPATGEQITIAAKSAPKFTFAKALKDAV